MSDNGLTKNGIKMKVGKTYKIDHVRKGKWEARVLHVDDCWVTLSDDGGDQPVRLSLLSATEIK